MEKASIIIPNFNGLELLKRNLPSLVEAKKYVSNKMDVEIIVADDGSTDRSGDFVKKSFPDIKFIFLERKMCFARTCNRGAESSNGEILIFLNNDVRVESNFIGPLIESLGKENVFAVGAKSITSKDWLYNESVTQAYFRKGVFILEHPERSGENTALNRGRHILYPCGVAFACKRDKFFKLGGFDEIYSPFFWEDVDLGYRSWKRGWQVLYEPRSLVHHQHYQTISQVISNDYAEKIFLRNSFIFTWKNITDSKLFYRHLFYLPYWVGLAFIQFRFRDLASLLSALKKWPDILKKRDIAKKETVMSDEDVLKQTWQR